MTGSLHFHREFISERVGGITICTLIMSATYVSMESMAQCFSVKGMMATVSLRVQEYWAGMINFKFMS